MHVGLEVHLYFKCLSQKFWQSLPNEGTWKMIEPSHTFILTFNIIYGKQCAGAGLYSFVRANCFWEFCHWVVKLLVALNQLWGKYLHYGSQEMLQIRGFSPQGTRYKFIIHPTGCRGCKKYYSININILYTTVSSLF